jgi:hypothetical protein
MSIKVWVCVEMAGHGGERADKRIWVRVAEFDGAQTAYGVPREKTVNGTHTVQAAVEECAGFPSRCLWVKVRRSGEFLAGELWRKGDPKVVWGRELYESIADGDEVVIVVSAYMPGGPRREEEGVRAAGPQGARLAGFVGASIESASIKERGRSGMDRERVGAMLARLGHLAGLAEEGEGHPAEAWQARKQNGGGVSYDDLNAYLPSRFDSAKMARVTYIDPNKYVIAHWAKWTDPASGASHRVEYRDKRYAHHDEDAFDVATLEKWQDGVLVETLSRDDLLARIKNWTYAPEPAIDVAVWRQLGVLVTHDVKMQWTVREGDGVHLMEIRRYRMKSTHDLFRDGKRLYEGQSHMTDEEVTKMNNWKK